jgi:hypothetical protein
LLPKAHWPPAELGPVLGVEDQPHADELLDLDLDVEEPGEQAAQARSRLGLRAGETAWASFSGSGTLSRF